MKKLVIIIMCLFVTLIPNMVCAKEKEKVTVYIFYGDGCPHCHAAFEFFDNIEEEYGKYFKLEKFETWNNTWSSKINRKYMDMIHEELGPESDNFGVPYIIIGEEAFIGYAESYDDDIKKAIVNEYNQDNRFDDTSILIKELKKETITMYGSFIGSWILFIVLIIVNEAVRAFKK